MGAVRWAQFSGEVPRLGARLLNDNQAQEAVNVRLTGGRLVPVLAPKQVTSNLISGAVKSIYRMYDSAGTSFWLNWESDTDLARAPVAGDATFRSYFTSVAFEPRVTNLALATSVAPYPTAWYVLGVFAPTSALTCTPSGSSGPSETRTYVYTFVTDPANWGEESAPSPASTPATGHVSGTWALSNIQTAPLNSYTTTAAAWSGGVLTLTFAAPAFGCRPGEYVTLAGFLPASINASWKIATVVGSTVTILMPTPGIITDQIGTMTRDAPHNLTGMVKRIYRSVTVSGVTTYYFIKEISAATTSTNDDVGSTIGEPLTTDLWAQPPSDLQGVKNLPSGALVGFRENELCFSEPYAPYAWPRQYRLTADFKIVGIGVFGTSVVVTTEGTPYIASGNVPAAMTMTKVDQNWPCLSKRGVVELETGVAYPAPQGLAMIGDSGPRLITEQLYTYAEWQLLNPSSFSSTYYDRRYYAGYQVTDDQFGIFVLDPDGLTYRMSPRIAGAYTDKTNGIMYVLQDGFIQQWEADQAYRLQAVWKSKEIVLPVPTNLAVARVEAEFFTSEEEAEAYAASVAAQNAANAVLMLGDVDGANNETPLNTYSLNGSAITPDYLVGNGVVKQVTFELYVDGQLDYSTTIKSSQTFRLPAGKKYAVVSYRLISTAIVNGVLIGTSAEGLREA